MFPLGKCPSCGQSTAMEEQPVQGSIVSAHRSMHAPEPHTPHEDLSLPPRGPLTLAASPPFTPPPAPPPADRTLLAPPPALHIPPLGRFVATLTTPVAAAAAARGLVIGGIDSSRWTEAAAFWEDHYGGPPDGRLGLALQPHRLMAYDAVTGALVGAVQVQNPQRMGIGAAEGGYIAALAVRPEDRGRGVGRLLMCMAIEQVRSAATPQKEPTTQSPRSSPLPSADMSIIAIFRSDCRLGSCLVVGAAGRGGGGVPDCDSTGACTVPAP